MAAKAVRFITGHGRSPAFFRTLNRFNPGGKVAAVNPEVSAAVALVGETLLDPGPY